VRRLEALRIERAARRDRVGKVGLELAEGERSGRWSRSSSKSARATPRNRWEEFLLRILRGDRSG